MLLQEHAQLTNDTNLYAFNKQEHRAVLLSDCYNFISDFTVTIKKPNSEILNPLKYILTRL